MRDRSLILMPDNTDENIEDLMRAENNRLAEILVPVSWGSSSQDLFVHWDEAKKRDVLNRRDDYKRFLKSKGLSGTKRSSEILSEVETCLAKIDAERQVDYIGKLACLPHGFVEVGDQRFYNTLKREELLQPDSFSPLEFIDEALAVFLGGKEHPQFFLMRDVFKWHVACRVMGFQWTRQIPPLTVLVGDSFDEGQIFSSLLTLVLGGEVIDPTPYLTGRVGSNSSVVLAAANHWSIKSLAKNSASLLHKLLTIEKLPFGKLNEFTLPFISQRTVFVHNRAEDLMELPHHLLDLANVIYLHPLNGYQCRFHDSCFAEYCDDLFDPGAKEVLSGYIAPEVKQTLFGATLAGEAYQILAQNMSGESVLLDEQAILTRIENSSRHFQNRMNREKHTPRTILEVISHQQPDQVARVSETHWRLSFPKNPTDDYESNDNLGNDR